MNILLLFIQIIDLHLISYNGDISHNIDDLSPLFKDMFIILLDVI